MLIGAGGINTPITISQPSQLLDLQNNDTYLIDNSISQTLQNDSLWQISSYTQHTLDFNNDGFDDILFQGATSLAPTFLALGDNSNTLTIIQYFTYNNLNGYPSAAHGTISTDDINGDTIADITFTNNGIIKAYAHGGTNGTVSIE